MFFYGGFFFFWLFVGNMLIVCDLCDNSFCVDICIYLFILERKSLYVYLYIINDICNKLIVIDFFIRV